MLGEGAVLAKEELIFQKFASRDSGPLQQGCTKFQKSKSDLRNLGSTSKL
jgi:hypothetical protein